MADTNSTAPVQRLRREAFRAILDLYRYAAVSVEFASLEVLQHIADCPSDGPPAYVTSIPFLFLYVYNGRDYDLRDSMCSSDELEQLRSHLDRGSRLLATPLDPNQLLTSETNVISFKQPRPPIHSFKLPTLGDQAAVFDVPFVHQRDAVLRAVLPASLDHAAIRIALTRILRRLTPSALGDIASTTVAPDHTLNGIGAADDRARFVSDDTRSRFTFLSGGLGRLSSGLLRTNNAIPEGLFKTTFLFLTTRRHDEWDRYRYIFTPKQEQALREKYCKGVLPSGKTLLSEVAEQVAREDKSALPVTRKWLKRVEKESLLEVLTQGDFYGPRSFIRYLAATRAKSLYVSDWRVWYPRKLDFLGQEEDLAFRNWLKAYEGSPIEKPWAEGTEPLARLLRSAIEEHVFQLKAMLMVPIRDPGMPWREDASRPPDPSSTKPPLAVVQLSSPEPISPALRIDRVTRLAVLSREVGALASADQLREELAQLDGLRHYASIAHTFTHAGHKLFSTPMANAIRRLKNGVAFRRLRGLTSMDKWALEDVAYSVRLLEKHLGLLGDLTRDPKGRPVSPVREFADWEALVGSSQSAIDLSFMRAIWDVVHDREYRDLEQSMALGKLTAAQMVQLAVTIPEPRPLVRIHNTHLQLHVASLLENAVEALDLKTAVDQWQRTGTASGTVRLTVKVQGPPRVQGPVPMLAITCSSSTRLLPPEEEALRNLEAEFRRFDSGALDPFLVGLRAEMDERRYTSKSGGGHGWALLNAASYFRRLELWRDGMRLAHGRTSIQVEPSGAGDQAQSNVRVTFEIPVPTNSNDELLFLVNTPT